MQACTHMHAHMHAPTHPCTHAHTHTHARMHTRTYACNHIHTFLYCSHTAAAMQARFIFNIHFYFLERRIAWFLMPWGMKDSLLCEFTTQKRVPLMTVVCKDEYILGSGHTSASASSTDHSSFLHLFSSLAFFFWILHSLFMVCAASPTPCHHATRSYAFWHQLSSASKRRKLAQMMSFHL